MGLQVIEGEYQGKSRIKLGNQVLYARLANLELATKLIIRSIEETQPLKKSKKVDRNGEASGTLLACISRLQARMNSLGYMVKVVPDLTFNEDLITYMEKVVVLYSLTANIARTCIDTAAAWVCELNRAELIDIMTEIRNLKKKS